MSDIPNCCGKICFNSFLYKFNSVSFDGLVAFGDIKFVTTTFITFITSLICDVVREVSIPALCNAECDLDAIILRCTAVLITADGPLFKEPKGLNGWLPCDHVRSTLLL